MRELLESVNELENQNHGLEMNYNKEYEIEPLSADTKNCYEIWQAKEKELKRAYALLARALIKKLVREAIKNVD